MTYIKPNNVTYTEMAIWIDSHVYEETCDENILYQYLYHLVNMLAHQYGYFNYSEEYDNFSLYSATRLFLRLTNSKQFELDEKSNPKMVKIKSILNYIKKVIYPYKVDFELEFQFQKNIDIVYTSNSDLSTSISHEANIFDILDFSVTLSDISKIVKAHLLKIPRKKNSAEWINIYTSCMLTLIDSITPPAHLIEKNRKMIRNKPARVEKMYQELRSNDPVLFHLPPSSKNYIKVLVEEVRHVLCSELQWKSNQELNEDSMMKNLICSSLNLEDD